MKKQYTRILDKRKIEIPIDILEVYETCYQRGDYAAISEIAYGSTEYRAKAMNALLRGEGDKVIVDAIVKFYSEVQKRQSNDIYEHSAE